MKTELDIAIVVALSVIAIGVLYAVCFFGYDGDVLLGGIVGGFISRLKGSNNA